MCMNEFVFFMWSIMSILYSMFCSVAKTITVFTKVKRHWELQMNMDIQKADVHMEC